MLLGIDTSGAISVAVARGALTDAQPLEILAVHSDERARHHDEVLMSLIDQALTDSGSSRTEITGVVAGRGPGPFTGLRVGLVTARSIASVLQVPLVGVSSLDALAHEAFASDPSTGTVGVALDARRREIYWAQYAQGADGVLERRGSPAVDTPADVAETLRASDVLVGTGAHLYADLLPPSSPLAHVSAAHLLLVAQQLTRQGEDLSSTEPMYLREPDAAKPTARKSALGL